MVMLLSLRDRAYPLEKFVQSAECKVQDLTLNPELTTLNSSYPLEKSYLTHFNHFQPFRQTGIA
jgi:hypothetical protein